MYVLINADGGLKSKNHMIKSLQNYIQFICNIYKDDIDKTKSIYPTIFQNKMVL